MNSASILYKVEGFFYTTLLSIMSGISRLKNGGHQEPIPENQKGEELEDDTPIMDIPLPPETDSQPCQSIQQYIIGILFWIVLGFAAGFLIGMLRSG